MRIITHYAFLATFMFVGIVSTVACSTNSTVEEITPSIPDSGGEEETDKWADAKFLAKFTENKTAVLLDLTARNGETETETRNLYSAQYLYEVAGFVFTTTTDLETALNGSDFLLLSSVIKDDTFTAAELERLRSWVSNGGTVVAPAVSSAAAGSLFGVSTEGKSKSRNMLNWASNNDYKELAYFDEPEETTMSIGYISTYPYTASNGTDVLATFNDGTAAVVRNTVGKGTTYAFPFLWRDLIQRSQLNKDSSGSRYYNNGFEPTADCASLFVRQAYAQSHAVAAWKHTIPAGYESVFIPTHDIDSTTGYDSLYYMARYETEIGVKGHYNLTTKYFRDYVGRAYYDDKSKKQVEEELLGKHTIGSHSVGHFPDMSKDSRFPLGGLNITKEGYNPYYDGTSTTGGYTYAEVAISKSLLEQDFGIKVNSFRSGHLCMNSYIDEAMKLAGIDYASCWTAAGLMSEFPFMERIGINWDGDEAVLQMPMHTSDVSFDDDIKISEDNYTERAAIWVDVAEKLRGNYAPCIILIHPNREWKMLAEKYLVEHLDRSRTGLYNFIDYGDFWTNRRSFTFTTAVNSEDGSVLLTVRKANLADTHDMCIMLTGGKTLSEDNIRVVDEDGNYHTFTLKTIGDNVCVVL